MIEKEKPNVKFAYIDIDIWLIHFIYSCMLFIINNKSFFTGVQYVETYSMQ